jgi:hypothetical protein
MCAQSYLTHLNSTSFNQQVCSEKPELLDQRKTKKRGIKLIDPPNQHHVHISWKSLQLDDAIPVTRIKCPVALLMQTKNSRQIYHNLKRFKSLYYIGVFVSWDLKFRGVTSKRILLFKSIK